MIISKESEAGDDDDDLTKISMMMVMMTTMMMMMMMMMTSPDKDLDGEPGVTDALDVEEGVVGVGAVLVQRPVGDVSTSRCHCDVPGSFDIL